MKLRVIPTVPSLIAQSRWAVSRRPSLFAPDLAHWKRYLNPDDVQAKKYSIIITKPNKPISKMVPLEEKNHSLLFGKINGTAHIKGDLIQSIEEDWDACL